MSLCSHYWPLCVRERHDSFLTLFSVEKSLLTHDIYAEEAHAIEHFTQILQLWPAEHLSLFYKPTFFPHCGCCLTETEKIQYRHSLNTHAGAAWNKLYGRRGAPVVVRFATPRDNALTQLAIGQDPSKIHEAAMATSLKSTPSLLRVAGALSVIPYTFTPPFVLLTKSLYCSLSMHAFLA